MCDGIVLLCTKCMSAMRDFLCTPKATRHIFLIDTTTGITAQAAERKTERAIAMTNRLVSTYKAWRKYRETYNELMRLSNRDLTDLGINRAEIPSIARQTAAGAAANF